MSASFRLSFYNLLVMHARFLYIFKMKAPGEIEVADKDAAYQHAASVVAALQKAGFAAYFVGGCVRDLLLDLHPKDYDVATSAHPEEVQRVFPQARGVGRSFGVCTVPVGDQPIEVAAFRQDGPYYDHRRPAWVKYAGIEEDARRRDFTINALYYNPADEQVVDPAGAGLSDLDKRLLRVIGDPFERLDEDWLRLLRAVRFAARFELEFEFRTWDALKALAPMVTGVSAERRTEETRLMLQGPNPARAIGLLYASGLWQSLWPDIPFSRSRLRKIADALERDRTGEHLWKIFFVDLPPETIANAAQQLRLTRPEKKSLGLL